MPQSGSRAWDRANQSDAGRHGAMLISVVVSAFKIDNRPTET
jgi:hypothetical protein